MYKSTKLVDGFSTCFRQPGAKSHCKFLHGYSLSFKLVFSSEILDENNWVMDFGFLKEDLEVGVTVREWFKYMFDHTTIISESEKFSELFTELSEKNIIQLRVVPTIGCEGFSKFVYDRLSGWVSINYPGVILESVECIENNKNSAIYYG